MDSQDVCQALDITKRTLQSYREKGLLPFSRIGGKYFYRLSDVEAFLEAKTARRPAAHPISRSTKA
ncbi:helix-turn-helix domain-containing protein [Alistipes indistinctus]|uniref:helix-turn-helix domain-containing protein n=1 Tax=Alistipes indistinctus TaxID=626932 RepID=UPI00267443D1|nr:helix-turn-helix domain-containing protein [Alistipes indistinctus]